ncbi:PREDICTED: uncharacterized protein LOC108368940 [Rhagoletis zephyria]|uniref:uncharacterized protein LOC108368940 n=1 Tax=Rhagoletis zephyria TaxID=28612 RepID=UPI00081166CD|nr:PREDICTED: uncharacterized protein LOC108368940 [Rhagoletis zephyria]
MSSATIALGHKNPSHTTSGTTQQQPKSNSNQIKPTSCNKNSNNMSNAISNQQLLSNSTTNLSDSRSNLTNPAAAPTPCQRLSEMFRRSIASSVQSSSRENTYEEDLLSKKDLLKVRKDIPWALAIFPDSDIESHGKVTKRQRLVDGGTPEMALEASKAHVAWYFMHQFMVFQDALAKAAIDKIVHTEEPPIGVARRGNP